MTYIMYIHFSFFMCSFFIINHSKSAFYVWKVASLMSSSLHLGPAIGNCARIMKRVSFFYLIYIQFFAWFPYYCVLGLRLISRPFCRFASWLSSYYIEFSGMHGDGFWWKFSYEWLISYLLICLFLLVYFLP